MKTALQKQSTVVHTLAEDDIQVSRQVTDTPRDLLLSTGLHAGQCDSGSKSETRSCCDDKGKRIRKGTFGIWECTDRKRDSSTGDYD